MRAARVLVCAAAAWALHAHAVTLADRARESGCTNKPAPISSSLFKCQTKSGGEAFFNVPDGRPEPAAGSARNTPSPANFPRVDNDTQKARDDMRRKVLGDELATEEKADAERYRQRIERLRQSVQLHERNVDALKKELGR